MFSQTLNRGMRTAVGNGGLMLANLLRDGSIARSLGISASSDAMFLGLSLPIFLSTVAVSCFRSICVPFLERKSATQDVRMVRLVVSRLTFVSMLVISAVAAVVAAIALFLAASAEPSSTRHLVLQVCIASLPMFAISTLCSFLDGPLQVARGMFLVPTLLRTAVPLGLAAGFVAGAGQNAILFGLTGGCLGAVVQCAACIVVLRHTDLSDAVTTRIPPAESRLLVLQFGHLLMGTSIAYLNPLINQWMVFPLGEGAASTVSYATRLSAGLATLLIGSLSPALLAMFSKCMVEADPLQLRDIYERFCTAAAWAAGALAFVTVIAARPVIALIYGVDALSAAGVERVADFLSIGILHIIPLATGCVGAMLLAATMKNHVLTAVGIMLALANVAANAILMSWLGATGIAVSSIIIYALSWASMNAYIWRKQIVKFRLRAALGILQPAVFWIGAVLIARALDLPMSAKPTLTDFAKAALSTAPVLLALLLLWKSQRRIHPVGSA